VPELLSGQALNTGGLPAPARGLGERSLRRRRAALLKPSGEGEKTKEDTMQVTTAISLHSSAPRRRIVADAKTRTAEEDARANGFVGAIPGTENIAVAIPEAEQTFDAARAALLEQGKVEGTCTKETAAGFTQKTKVLAKDGRGRAREITVTERMDGEGKVTSLVSAEGQVKLDKEALFAHILTGLTLGPVFSGAIDGNGSLRRPITGWELRGKMFREAYATWDVIGKCIDESKPVGLRDWQPAFKVKRRQTAAWANAKQYAAWAKRNEDPLPVGGTPA
jgi:hypothetical protein